MSATPASGELSACVDTAVATSSKGSKCGSFPSSQQVQRSVDGSPVEIAAGICRRQASPVRHAQKDRLGHILCVRHVSGDSVGGNENASVMLSEQLGENPVGSC